jgi:hypothetical protein
MGEERPPQRNTLAAAAWTSTYLSVLFLVVYGTCNWLASLRPTGTWFFEWERRIPFVALLIVPYMSIDLFYVAAPFFCRDALERRTLARRITFAVLVAGAFFLLMPLHFAFDRPHAEGWLGAVFDGFRMMDRPHNLFPSLHITLCLILAEHYVRHTRGLLRAALVLWFVLIGLSTGMTFQHHVIDLAGGFVLACVCFYLFREAPGRLAVVRNVRIGVIYGVGAVLTGVVAALTWPWGSVLLWPALALAFLTAAYWGLGPGVYRKSEGRLPASARLVLAPMLLGQYGSLVWYRRRCRPWDEVVPGVWVGRRLTDREAAGAVRQGVTAVLDLTVEFSEARPFLALTYRHLPVLDLTAPTPEQMREAAAFIGEHVASGVVYVHCKAGYSRSAAAVGAYLLATGYARTADEAVRRLRAARPSVVIRPEVLGALRAFERAAAGDCHEPHAVAR